jgi:murein tripeptide amidase MpaA
VVLLLGAGRSAAAEAATATVAPPVLFNTAFESGSLGRVEKLGETEFRLHVRGQQDARGRNRQATWFHFRMDDVAGRELTLRLTSFKGEYNDRPAASPAGAWYRPVLSEDGEHWRHVGAATWDAEKDELTFTVRPAGNTLWLAHVPPYPTSRLERLLAEIGASPHVRIASLGRSALGRELPLVTVTNRARPDAAKRVVWLQARQHAWETGTSFVVEGALRFLVSDDPAARTLRDETVFLIVPMLNPDAVAAGEVRFNAHGFDPNRHWDEVGTGDPRWRDRLPEVWHVQRALIEQHARQPIHLALNLHNTELGEYIETMADAAAPLAVMHRFFGALVTETTFDPSRPKLTLFSSGPAGTTNAIWRIAGVPMMLMEQRIGPGRKLPEGPTTEARLEFGRKLIGLLAAAARDDAGRP